MSEYSDLDIAPSPDFADLLEATLLRDLGFPEGDVITIDRRAAPASTGRPPARRRLILGLTAAAAAILAVVAIALTRGDSTRPPATVPSSTSPTATTVALGSADIPRAAPGDLAPGRYRNTTFAVDLTFETTDDWIVRNNRADLFVLLRLTGPTMSMSTGIFDGRSAAEVAADLCPGAIDHGAQRTTTLLGREATQIEGTVLEDCRIVAAADVTTLMRPGDIVQITVADVDGRVVVVTAGTNAAVWERVSDEVDLLVSTMEPIESPITEGGT